MHDYNEVYDGSAAGGVKSSGSRYHDRYSTTSDDNSGSNSDEESGSNANANNSIINNSGGIHAGDMLRGIWLYDSDIENTTSISDILKDHDSGGNCNSYDDNSGKFIMVDKLNTTQIRQLVTDSALVAKGRDNRLLIRRENNVYNKINRINDDNEEQNHVRKIAVKLLATGNYWSYDDYLAEAKID